MNPRFDKVSLICSKSLVKLYGSGISMVTYGLSKKYRSQIYCAAAFIATIHEIVDNTHVLDQRKHLIDFSNETYKAIEQRFSLNPILNSFQKVVNDNRIDIDLVSRFLKGKEISLYQNSSYERGFETYILDSIEASSLLFLKILCDGNNELFEKLKINAQSFGQAIYKINLLKNVSPYAYKQNMKYKGVQRFSIEEKLALEREIEECFKLTLEGIKMLPKEVKQGVYAYYNFHLSIFRKIKLLSAEEIFTEKIKVPYNRRITIAINSIIKHKLNLI